MREDLNDRAAGDLLSLIPLYRNTVLRLGHGMTGIQGAQFRVLHILSLFGVQQMSEIGRRLYISKPYMTALIEAMIEEGYVLRQPDPDDRRVIRIEITPKGRSHLSRTAAGFKNQIRGVIATLDDADLELLCGSLQTLRNVLEKLPEG